MLNVIPKPFHTRLAGGCIKYPAAAPPMKIHDPSRPPEGYILTVAEGGVTAACADDAGYFYASQTLKQLRRQFGSVLPKMTVEDKPRFGYRAFMIDCARHFFKIDDLKRMIDAAALFKFNIFHWHLTDDQGWRADLPDMPELCEKGSVRTHSHFGSVHDPAPYGGFYTQDEMREIVRYCRERFIEVVPEFELPGHVSALLRAHPELSCGRKPVELKATSGVFKDVLCAGNAETLNVLFKIFDGFCNIFDGKYFHIGGDEVPKNHWQGCPECQAKIKALGLKSEDGLQGWLMNQAAGYLKSKGKTVIAWNESLRGGNLDGNIVTQLWMDREGLSAARANAGHPLIVSDFFHCYMDYPYGMTPLKKVYLFDPLIDGLTAAGAANVAGIDVPIWAEYVRTPARMGYLCYPRFIAAAERAWSTESTRDYADFRARLKSVLPLLDGVVEYAPEHDWDPNPLRRVVGTAAFFGRAYNRETIDNIRK